MLQVAGSWRSLPGSQISWAGRAKVPRKATHLAFVAYAAACLEIVLLGTPKPLVVRFVQAHVDTSAVLQVPFLVGFAGAFLQQGIGDFVVDVLLL